MIRSATGDILQDAAEAIVNPVNCMGVMGKGLALQFKIAFPLMFAAYQREAKAGRIKPGLMHIYEMDEAPPGIIINFPTKGHWRDQAKLDDIIDGLVDLEKQVKRLKIQSVAIPPVGCGLGGLDWGVVRPMILDAFLDIPWVDLTIYEPTKR